MDLSSRPLPPRVSYALDPETSTFRIEGYNWAPPFSNFLPGIAGLLGVPAWAYWVNRGQALSGLGVGSRDGQILELYSFNKACLRVEREGFRTFISLDGGEVHEPFRRAAPPGVTQVLEMNPAELRLAEEHADLGLVVVVTYLNLPGRRAAGLVRTVSLTDTTGSAQRALVNTTGRQEDSLGSMGADEPANGEGVIEGTPQYAQDQPYGAAVAADGRADCEAGQRGFVERQARFFPERYKVARDAHSAGLQGTTFTGRPRVPPGAPAPPR